MPSNERAPDAIRTLRAERERLKQAHDEGLSGRALIRSLAAAMDAAITAIWGETAGEGERAALVALGGYGRGELSPHSDVDLMVLHAGARGAAEAGKRLFYELWDAGFMVGHAIRTVKESLKLAAVNLEVATSFLDARLLAGDEGMFDDFAGAVIRQTRRRGARFLGDVRASTAARHAKEGHASSNLEPNLKDGAGGLRDLHVLGWLERVFGDGGKPEAADPGDPDRAGLGEAAEMLHRVRNYLHYRTDRRTDVLLLPHQEPVAAFLGYAGNGRSGVDAFLRELYAGARAIEFASASALTELAGSTGKKRWMRELAPGIVVENDRVRITRRVPPAEEPALPMHAFAGAARAGVPVAAETVAWLRREAEAGPAELPWPEEVRRAFFDILASGAGGTAALEAMDRAGLLTRYLPEWDAVRCQPQHNVYHRFTVDVHLFATVAALGTLEAGTEDQLERDVWRDVWQDAGDRERLLLACLLHDVGKGTDEDHSVRGETIAAQVCKRMALNESAAQTVTWLVRNHLLLSDTATRRDVRDENLVVETAAAIGDVERLKMLYLLSIADGRATGPAAWGPWKSTLVAELFTRILHVLQRSELVGRDASDLLRLRTTELRQALTRYPQVVVESHLANMPRAYFLAFPTGTLIRHFALMAEPTSGAEIATHVARTEAHGVHELTLVSQDRPGLFSKVSGGLALNGINVLSAQVFTRADGVALEVFRVEGAHEPEIGQARWEHVFSDVRRALSGRISLDVRIAEKRDAYTRPSKGKREPPRVIVDNRASDFYTVVEVHATDRVGLLYAITRALADLELDIHAAKVATYAEDVVDVFYVRDVDGQKITDPEHIREIERTVLMRVEG